MQATTPFVEVPGDNASTIMARSGTCLGMNPTLAVWRFGFAPGSEASRMHNVWLHNEDDGPGWQGFMWVLATRKTGKVKDTFRGYAVHLPRKYRNVINWEPK